MWEAVQATKRNKDREPLQAGLICFRRLWKENKPVYFRTNTALDTYEANEGRNYK